MKTDRGFISAHLQAPDMSSTALRLVPLVALVGLVPGVLFALDRSAPVIGLSTVSVVLIAGSLYWMLSEDAAPTSVAE